MLLLLDQGPPRTTVQHLREAGIEALHTGAVGLASAKDEVVLERARDEGRVVVALDVDFHTLLALSGACAPSVIRIRIEGLRAEELAPLIASVLGRCPEDLKSGALVSVTESGIRVRRLPVLR